AKFFQYLQNTLLNFFNVHTAGSVSVSSSSANDLTSSSNSSFFNTSICSSISSSTFLSVDAASAVSFIFFKLCLLLNLYNHPLLAVNGFVSSSVESFLKSSYRLKAFCHDT
ncbi:hypothetical protein OTU49_004299, partial [Cherax quadricarinatus]